MKFRPGPESIEPGRAPGGLVVHVYDLTGALLLERPLRNTAEAEATAAEDGQAVADAAAGCDVIMVIFDGDTGERGVLR